MSGSSTSSPPTARRRAARPTTRAVALAVGAVLLAGCGGGGEGGGGAAPTASDPDVGTVTVAPDGVQEVTLETPDGYRFLPDAFTVSPGRVRVTLRNTDQAMVHNFRFTPGQGPAEITEQIDLLRSGETETVEFEVAEPGEYPFDCSFHLQLGQVGTMTVAG